MDYSAKLVKHKKPHFCAYGRKPAQDLKKQRAGA